MKWVGTLIGCGIVAVALWLRIPHLGERPFHTDESVHAYKFAGLWERGVYRYDPDEYHGPTLSYATLAWLGISRALGETGEVLRESRLRAVPLLFGVGLLAMLGLVSGALGRSALGWAGLWTAVSPAFTFYSQYYIHELLLVAFTFLLIGAGWKYWQTRAWGWALWAGIALGLMHSTKETFVFALAAIVAAGAAVWYGSRRSSAPLTDDARPNGGAGVGGVGGGGWTVSRIQSPALWHLALGGIAAAAVSVVLFSSFFSNASGPIDSLRTYLPWFERARGESPHIHPWWFYWERLGWFHRGKGPVWTEGLILGLAVVGGVAAWARQGRLGGAHTGWVRFLGIFTFTLALIYTCIPYKTPWCALGFYHGALVLAGVGAATVVSWGTTIGGRAVILVLLGAGALHLGWQAWELSSRYATDQRNPHVYAHTSRDLRRLLERVQAIAGVEPKPEQVMLQVMAPGGDYWPLPWYLRGFRQTGWHAGLPADPWAPIMIVSSKFEAELDERSEKRWLMTGLFEHRPKVFFELYVELELWKRFVASLPPPSDDDE